MRLLAIATTLLTIAAAAPFEDFLVRIAGDSMANTNIKRQSNDCANPDRYTPCPGLDFCAEPGTMCCPDGSGSCPVGTLCRPNTDRCCYGCAGGQSGPIAPPLSSFDSGSGSNSGNDDSYTAVGATTTSSRTTSAFAEPAPSDDAFPSVGGSATGAPTFSMPSFSMPSFSMPSFSIPSFPDIPSNLPSADGIGFTVPGASQAAQPAPAPAGGAAAPPTAGAVTVAKVAPAFVMLGAVAAVAMV